MSRIQKGAVNLDFENAEARFQKAFNNFLSTSKKSTKELWTQQVSGIVRNLFSVTPPMGGKNASLKLPAPGQRSRGIVINFAEGKARGQSTERADIANAFQRVNKSNPQALDQYLALRTKLKRIRRGVPKILATASEIAAVRKNIEARQGATASGWNAAVRKMSVSGIPKWITRHSIVPSKCSIQEDQNGSFSFEAINGTSHVDSSRIERRIGIAINMQANSIERWLKVYNERLGNDFLK